MPDSDSTAKTLTALNLLGRPKHFDTLIKRYEQENHFECFPFERNPSFSVNCNILLGFVQSPAPSEYRSQIMKCLKFISDWLWNSDKPLTDKWVPTSPSAADSQNSSPYYSSMLAAQGLIRALHLYEAGILEITDHVLLLKIILVLFQILSRTLQQQSPDGSWGHSGSREETSYALIGLTYVASMAFTAPLWDQIQNAVQRGRSYLTSINALGDLKLTPKDFIWVAKVSYGVENVCYSYVLAALNVAVPHCVLGLEQLVDLPLEIVEKSTQFYATLPRFEDVGKWRIKAWIVEGYLFMSVLQSQRFDVFSGNEAVVDLYSQYIPFSWTAANGLADVGMGGQSLSDMMQISTLIFQIDEFFQDVVERRDISAIRTFGEEYRRNVPRTSMRLQLWPHRFNRKADGT